MDLIGNKANEINSNVKLQLSRVHLIKFYFIGNSTH